MKRQVFTVLTMLALFSTLMVAGSHAQTNPKILVEIPFNFEVGSKVLPPGEYTVEVLHPGQQTLLIRSTDFREKAIVLTNTVQAASRPAQPRLIFNRYGDQYFLARVWTSSDVLGCELIKSHRELRLANSGSPHETASLAGHPQ